MVSSYLPQLQWSLVDLEKKLPRCLAALDIRLCFGRLGERVHAVDVDCHLSRRNEIEQLTAVLLKFLPRADVAVDSGAQKPDVLGTELENAEGRHSSGLGRMG